MDIGMPPSPRALTFVSPIWRTCTGFSSVPSG
jgi:hypothetical protein